MQELVLQMRATRAGLQFLGPALQVNRTGFVKSVLSLEVVLRPPTIKKNRRYRMLAARQF